MRTFKTFIVAATIVSGFSFTNTKPCGEPPALNKKVIEFVNANMNKQVATGECWDLAAGALKFAGATWDGDYKFGKEVDYKKVCIFPGDIIQFEGVELRYNIEDAILTEKLTHHTAIIYTVKGKGDYMIADQNTKYSAKKVATHAFDVKTITKGKFKIFRPQK